MKTLNPIPDPSGEPTPQDIARGLAELERHVAEQAAPVQPPAPSSPPPAAPAPVVGGNTKRVQQLRAEVAEAHLLAELQEDEAPLLVDTPKVRKHRKRAAEAARLHALAQDPAALAYRDAKVRRTVTMMLLGAAGIALAVSSIGVQASVARAMDLKPYTLGWWAAFGVEPALSLPLLGAVAVQAYSAMRGKVVDRKSPEGRRLFRVELVLLALTLVLNCWPAFRTDFDLLDLIVHSLGPVAAVLSVWVLPTIWKVLGDLPMLWSAAPASRGATGRKYRANTPFESGGESGPADPDDIEAKAARIRALIAAGQLPAEPGADKIRRALSCAMDTARAVRDRLAADGWDARRDEGGR